MHGQLRVHQLKSKLSGARSFPKKLYGRFGVVCRALAAYDRPPGSRIKAAEWLAHHIHRSVRACKNYIAGRREAPGSAYTAILNEMERR